jgi:hypothetical protein
MCFCPQGKGVIRTEAYIGEVNRQLNGRSHLDETQMRLSPSVVYLSEASGSFLLPRGNWDFPPRTNVSRRGPLRRAVSFQRTTGACVDFSCGRENAKHPADECWYPTDRARVTRLRLRRRSRSIPGPQLAWK